MPDALSSASTLTLNAPWAGGTPRQGQVVVALAVTSAGVPFPACGQNRASRIDYADPLPTLAGEEAEVSARIAALAIGQLESWQAYPALYRSSRWFAPDPSNGLRTSFASMASGARSSAPRGRRR
jgi:hypothetical protein